MFDEGQRLPSPYHRTKFESERIVREQPYVPWRVYRPGIVVGDSHTGEMDKIDGPYYFFKSIQRMRQLLPEWTPLVGLDLGNTNVVPVDWVACALEHIAHEPDLDGRAFHLTDPRRQRVDELINEFAAAAHAPRVAVSIDKRLTDPLPKWPLQLALALPPLAPGQEPGVTRAGNPTGGARAHGARAPLRHARSGQGAGGLAAGRAARRCTTTPRGCGTTGSATWIRAWRAGARCRRRSRAGT